MRKPLKIPNLRFIKQSEIPKFTRGRLPICNWRKLLETIPEGKALVLPLKEWNPTTIHHRLRKFQEKGLFLNYRYGKCSSEGNGYLIHEEAK